MLKNKLVDLIAFLENLAVKDSQEKDLFFKRLPAAIPNLPQPVAQRKLLPMLASECPARCQWCHKANVAACVFQQAIHRSGSVMQSGAASRSTTLLL